MIKFNVRQVLENAQDELNKPKDLPKIIVKVIKSNPEEVSSIEKNKAFIKQSLAEQKTDSVNELWHEYNQVALERKKLSSQIWVQVEKEATQNDLKELYNKIESFNRQMQNIFDDIRNAEREMMKSPEVDSQNESLKSLKYEKKKLTEKRSKLSAKIKKGKATNATRLSDWELDLDKTDLEYKELDDKIRRLEGR